MFVKEKAFPTGDGLEADRQQLLATAFVKACAGQRVPIKSETKAYHEILAFFRAKPWATCVAARKSRSPPPARVPERGLVAHLLAGPSCLESFH